MTQWVIPTRTTAMYIEVSRGATELSQRIDQACGGIESRGNQIISISHSTHTEPQPGTSGHATIRLWSVVIAYRKVPR